jgi:hypothetical protein
VDCIIIVRIILILTALIISRNGEYYFVMPCSKLNWLIGSQSTTIRRYPSSAPYFDGTDIDSHAPVHADFGGKKEQVVASLDVSFGMALWLGLFLHAIGIEIYVSHIKPLSQLYLLDDYLSQTRGETIRLRQISYERQLKAGFKNLGYAGITFDAVRDEPWVPQLERIT